MISNMLTIRALADGLEVVLAGLAVGGAVHLECKESAAAGADAATPAQLHK